MVRHHVGMEVIMMIARTVATVSAIHLILLALLSAQSLDHPMRTLEDVEEASSRALLSNCDPVKVGVRVTVPSLGNDEVELVESSLRQNAEETLRTAGILRSGPGTPYLSIRIVQASGTKEHAKAVFVSVVLMKPATDDYGNRHVSTAWVGTQLALPMSDFNLAFDVVRLTVSKFAITYLRVNSAACTDRN